MEARRALLVTVVFSGSARVDLGSAKHTRPAGCARARVLGNAVRARRAISARGRDAVVVVHLAVVAAPAARAHAAVRERVVEACGGMQARVGCALVELGEACSNRNVGVARRARARVRVSALRTAGTMQARRRRTLIDIP